MAHTMPLQLPTPRAPHAQGTPAPARRAYRLWQTGQGHAQHQRWGQAANAFASAHDLAPDPPYGLAAAHALICAGRAPQAVQRARATRQQFPDNALGYTLESHALLAMGRHAEAVQCLNQQPAHVARDVDHLRSLALALQRGQRHADAVPVFIQALSLKMTDAHLHFQLGMSFKDLGLKAEAAECVRTAIALGVGSSDMAARGQLWFLERESCRWPQAESAARDLHEIVRALPDGTPMEANPFTHATLADDPLQVLKVARHHALHAQRQCQPLPTRTAQAHAGRLRLGYLSADFHTHATSQLMVQLLEAHDRAAFEVHLFSTGPDDASALRGRIERACEHFVDLRGLPAPAMAERVRAAGIDILIDLKGATFDTLLPVLAHRPAPLQVTWLGFPGSTGAPFIDYLIGDPQVTPLAHADHFSEKIAQLPQCYQPNDAHREWPQPTPRAELGLPEFALVLCAFHQSYKISPAVFDTWCELLHELPQAVLWLLHWNTNVEQALRQAAAQRGIDSQRLHFAPVVPLTEHLARLASADLYLDAWPCNAHTTAGEALWMGVPVVTLTGPTFAQRVGASLLTSVGLPGLITHDVAAYRRRVVDLAAKPSELLALRLHLAQPWRTKPLFDGAQRARELEALLQRMWQRAVSGLPADHLEAQA